MKNKIIKSCILARVSTNMESQDSSLDFQVEELSKIIKENGEEFNSETDIFTDRYTGTKLNRPNAKTQGFDDLMKILNFEISDIKNNDFIELSIKVKVQKEYRYNKIYCKSTSRISRAGSKGESLLQILKDLGIEVYFYDIRKSTFNMSDLELTISSLIDSDYSKKMSFNWRNNNVYRAKNKYLMLKGERFGWDKIKINGLDYFKINKTEFEALRLAYRLIVEEDKGCDSVAQEFIKRGIKTKRNTFLDKSAINKILKDLHYIGQEKYYDYPQNYVENAYSGRDYLKNLNFKWEDCEYIEPIFTDKEFNQIQEKFKERSHTNRGVRNPYLPITKKLKCGCCGANYYSKGSTNYFNERGFKCSTQRISLERRELNCHNFTFYESYLNNYLDKLEARFSSELSNLYQYNTKNLLYLKYHLVLILKSDTDDSFEKLLEQRENLETQLENLILTNLSSETGIKTIKKIQNKLDNELKEVDNKIIIYTNLKEQIKEFIFKINDIYFKLLEDWKNVKKDYTREEVLNHIKYIFVFPKTSEKKMRKNRVVFLHQKNEEVEIFNLLDEILKSDVKNILPEKTFTVSKTLTNIKYIVREPTEEQIEQALAVLEELGIE